MPLPHVPCALEIVRPVADGGRKSSSNPTELVVGANEGVHRLVEAADQPNGRENYFRSRFPHVKTRRLVPGGVNRLTALRLSQKDIVLSIVGISVAEY